MLTITIAQNPEDVEAVRKLLLQYGQSRNFDSAFGDYKTELAMLPGPYSSPAGCLLLATFAEEAAGCVAFKQLTEDQCEMKRLYVSPVFHRKGIGKVLVQKIVEQARQAGYLTMRLDTHPSMHAAKQLYFSLGFEEINRYNNNPTPGIRFFELTL